MSRRDGFDAGLREALGRTQSPAGPACPDEETLAVLVEGRLARHERRDVDRHLAGCARCRATLLALRDAASESPAAPGRASLLRAWRPAIAALATAAVGVVLAIRFFPETGTPLRREPAAPASAPKDEPAALAESARRGTIGEAQAPPPAPPARGAEPASPPPGARERADAGRPAETALDEARELERGASPSAAKPEPRPATEGLDTERSIAAEKKEEAEPRQRRAPAAGAPVLAKRADGSARPPAPGARSERASDGDASGAGAARDADRAEGFAAQDALPDERAATGMASRVEVAPTHAPGGWRAGEDGSIERFDAETGLWREVPLGFDTGVTAVAGVSDTVAWAVAARGTVLRTLDGDSWTQVAAPTGEDLVDVAATSREQATVTTRSGARFATGDGGRSWSRR